MVDVKLLSEIVFLFLLVWLGFNLVFRRVTVPVMFIVIYYMFSDYALYNLGYDIGELSIGKVFIEVIFLIVFIVSLSKFYEEFKFKGNIEIGKKTLSFIIFLILIPVVLVVVGSMSNGLSDAINGWRAIFLPIVLSEMLFFVSPGAAKSDKFWNEIVLTFIAIAVINSVFSIYQYVSYTGDMLDTWRYYLLLDAREIRGVSEGLNEHFLQYQIERDNNLRSSGFIVSALNAGYFTAIAMVFSFFKMTQSRGRKLVWGLISITLFFGIYVSQVRTALIIFMFGIIVYFWLKVFSPNRKLVVLISILLPFLIGFISIIQGEVLDSSSQGRIIQYENMMHDFRVLGYGLGSYLGKFDSYYIHICMTLGIFAIIPIVYFYTRLSDLLKSEIRGDDDSILVVVSLSVILFSVFFVQHVASSLYYFLSILLMSGFVTKFSRRNSILKEGE